MIVQENYNQLPIKSNSPVENYTLLPKKLPRLERKDHKINKKMVWVKNPHMGEVSHEGFFPRNCIRTCSTW